MDASFEQANFVRLSEFVDEECGKRLKAYEAQPRDAAEHFETENEVLSGGYAYRQLYELVQNAADAILEAGDARGRIHVRLSRNRLVAANTGAALDEQGIVALLNARSSSKRGNQIGRFGIGFKSLLKLGGRVDLVSRSVGLRFDPAACRERIRRHLGLAPDAPAPGMRLAEVLDPADPEGPLSHGSEWDWATTVVSADISDPAAFERLQQELADFPAEFLLFLPSDISLELEVAGAGRRQISKRLERGLAIIRDGSAETRWKVFETRLTVASAEARADATHIQARDVVPLAWAVPLGGREQAGRFWAFFPTETHSLTSGILNAPWKLNSDRTNLIRGPWNEAIMEEAARLIAASLPDLPEPDDQGAAVSAFPRQPDRQDEIAVPLVKALWERIIQSEVLPSIDGKFHRPTRLNRHFIEDTEICARWAEVANAVACRRYLHPHCYSFRARISRLNALEAEAKRRDLSALRRVSAEEWFNCVGSADPAAARKSLRFVGSLMPRRYEHGIYSVPQSKVIPTSSGILASPSEAIIVAGNPPAGFLAVDESIASDPSCRRILVEQLEVKELATESWEVVLRASLEAAEECDDAAGWENFWRNLESCPPEARQTFLDDLDDLDVSCLKFLAASGKWSERQLLMVSASAADISADHLMDASFVERVRALIPADWQTVFPSAGDLVSDRDSEIQQYLRWVSPHFDAVCRERSGSTPQFLPTFLRRSVTMPGGWRLLPHVPGLIGVQLTTHLLRACRHAAYPAVTIVHPTRENAYPKVTAPHPIYHWLTEHGVIGVGNRIVPMKAMDLELSKVLDAAGIGGFDQLAEFFHARDGGSELATRLVWSRSKLDPASAKDFWRQIFSELEGRKERLTHLNEIWDLAYSDGAIPIKVPTRHGPLPLSQIYVTADRTLGKDLEDGRIVLLEPAAVSGWAAAGARPLASGRDVSYHRRASEPSRLLDIFPELTAARQFVDGLDDLMVVWVEGLEEKVGPVRRSPTVAMDDDVVVIDRHGFERGGWAEVTELLLDCLSRHGLIDDESNLDSLLVNLRDQRAEEARKAVRAEPSLVRRLLRVAGGEVEPFLDLLPSAVRNAVGNRGTPETIAELALAVHGPTLLSRLREVLDRHGLAPPRRWGGEPARTFVLELGFPLEFASVVSGRREAEVSVSGPISLPPLHDYQEEILADIGKLLSSGEGRRRAVISLPTGAGKTRVTAEAAVRLVLRGNGRRSVLWIAQTEELCEQAVQCFRQLWVNIGKLGEDLRIVRFWGGQRNPAPSEGDEPTVVVASIQTLSSRSRNAEVAWIAEAGIIVIDECHHAITSSYTDLLRWLDIQVGSERARRRETPVLGLSATPWRGYDEDESERLAGRFDRRWLPADQAGLHERLSAMGVLATRSYRPLHYGKPVTLTEREQQHVETFGELPDSVVERMGEDDDRNDLLINSVLNSTARSVLLFANSVSHAQYLAARLHLAGCPAAAVSGQTDRLARQHFTRRFRAGDLRVICNHSVLTTGFDAPRTDMIVISRPVFSPVLYMQMVGRGLRGPTNGGTRHCEIVTVEDNIVNFSDRLAYHFCRRFFDA